MNENVFNKIDAYYNNLVATYGHDPKACDYGHSVSQQIKFKVLSSCTDFTNKSVLDIGCGFADYYSFLSQKFKEVNYNGVDLSSAMIQSAKELHPTLNLAVKNVFLDKPGKKYDIVTANGIFYLLGNEAWELTQSFIIKMYEMAEEVVAFNSLSTWAKDQEPNEFYADPAAMLNFCRTLSPWVSIHHEYHHRDFTIFIYKNQHQF